MDIKSLMGTQDSVALQRIWSRVVDGTSNLPLLRPMYLAFAEQMNLSDASAKDLWEWIAEGGLATKANDIYDSSLTLLERMDCSVPLHRGGEGEPKRGRVSKRI